MYKIAAYCYMISERRMRALFSKVIVLFVFLTLPVITSYSIHYTKLYDSVTDFYHLVVSSVSSLNVNNDFVVNGNLNITSGNLLLNTYLLTLHGNLTNSSAYSDDNISGGITLVGSSQQIVSVITSYSIHYTKLYDYKRKPYK